MTRPPAQSSLRGLRLFWEPLDATRLDWLAPLVARHPFQIEGAYPAARGAAPSYVRLSCADTGRHDAFVKLIPAHLCRQEREVAQLGLMLAAGGIVTPTLRDDVELSDGTTAFVYEWMDGRQPCGSVPEMTAIGRALAALQLELKRRAPHFDVERRTQARLAELERLAKSSQFAERWRGSDEEDFAHRMRAAYLRESGSMRALASPCHGDLNAGNLLVREDGTPVFIDLEDALHTAVWPGFDLAKLVERLVLPIAAADPAQAIAALIESYISAPGSDLGDFRPGNGSLARAMRWHLGLAVLILTAHNSISLEVRRAEMLKFAEIEQLIRHFEHLL